MGLRPIDKTPGASSGGGGGGELPDGFMDYVQSIAANATAAKNTADAAKTTADNASAAVASKASQADITTALNPVIAKADEALTRTNALAQVDADQALLIAGKTSQTDVTDTVTSLLGSLAADVANAVDTASSAALDAANALSTAESVYSIADDASYDAAVAMGQINLMKTNVDQTSDQVINLIEDVMNVRIKADAALPATEAGQITLYPGGTVSAPAWISTSNRIEVENPFPGKPVMVKVEVMIGGIWGDPGFTFDPGGWSGYGVKVSQVGGNDSPTPKFDQLVVQAGNGAVAAPPALTGSPHQNANGSETTLPYRLVVWKIKG